jgi:dTDP-4-amino-4,6-dideoxygalactose transaminase
VLPFALPEIGGAELDEIRQVLESGWITTGPKVHRFERDFADYAGVNFAVAVNSCTAAMHLALDAVGVQAGDYVITTPYTFAATAEVVRHCNAIPVFVDVDRDTLNIDPRRLVDTIEDLTRCLERGASPATVGAARALAGGRRADYAPVQRRDAAGHGGPALKALLPVHVAGHPCDLDVLSAIAAEHSLALVEDCAHACSAAFNGRRIGSAPVNGVPWAACFSFYATKTLTTGEGGMVTTDSEQRAERLRVMSLHGISKDAWKRYTAEGNWYYEILEPGYKYNMSDLMAGIGLAQLRKVEQMRRRREQIAERYTEAFRGHAAVDLPVVRGNVRHAWHLYMLRLNRDHLSIDRNQFVAELKKRQIGSSVHFIPLHIHPYYETTYGYRPDDFPVAYHEYEREVSLPIYSKMNDRDVDDVIDAVTEIVRRFAATSDYACAGR